MRYTTREDRSLRRVIGRVGFGAMNINGVIGAGIFGLPAVVAAQTGAFSPWIFLLAGLMTFTVVLCFARAASMFRNTGGIIVYATHAFGPVVGFQAGWLSYIGRVSAVGANANLLVTYASWFWAPMDTEPYRSIVLCTLISGLTWVNVRGIQSSLWLVYVFTLLKLLPLSLLILFGMGHIDFQMLASAEFPEIGVLGESVLIVVYAFAGFEGSVVAAGEGRFPRNDIPVSLVRTILLIGAIYIMVQLVSLSVLPGLATSEMALAEVANVLFGPIGATILTLGAVFSITGNLSATVLVAPRITYALARDGSMPSALAKIHPVYNTPHVSLWFYGGLCLFAALTGSFIWLAIISTLVRILSYIVCIAALPRLQKTIEPIEGQFELPGGYVIPVIALLLSLWLLTFVRLDAWLMTFAYILFGSLLYLWSKRHNPNN